MADFKQALRKENEKAATLVLRSEFETIKTALSKIADEHNDTVKRNKYLCIINDSIIEDIKIRKDFLLKLDIEYNEKIKTLEGKEQEITTLCHDKEAKSKGIEQESRDKVLVFESRYRDINVLLGKQVVEFSQISAIMSKLKEDINQSQLTLNGIHGRIHESKKELRAIKLAKDDELTELDKQIKDKSNGLETVSVLLQQERDKISKPMELLREASQEINKAKQDLDIAQSQIAQRWEKAFPGTKYIYVNL